MTQTICIFGEHMIGFDHVSSMASSEWLTSELAANGYLLSGRVAAVDQRVSRIGATMTSTFYQLDINYTPDFAGTAPSSASRSALPPIAPSRRPPGPATSVVSAAGRKSFGDQEIAIAI